MLPSLFLRLLFLMCFQIFLSLDEPAGQLFEIWGSYVASARA